MGASVPFTVSANDAEDGDLAVSCDHPSGDTFSITTTTVNCTSDPDSDGNVGTGSFKVTVQDTTPPSIDQPSSITDTTPDATKTINYPVPNATDLVAGPVTPVCTPGSGSSFPASLGGTTTQVSCTASDGTNQSEVHFDVTLTRTDTTPPTFNATPPAIVAEATSSAGATVTFATPTATDNVGTPTVSCAPASGTVFSFGTTNVTCTATDGATPSNSAQVSFGVTVHDTTAPVIPPPSDVTIEATGPSGAVGTYPAVTASDAVDGTIAANCTPASGSTLSLGGHTVTCNATDAHSNPAAPKTFTINVQDTTAPVLTGAPAQINVEANGPTGSIVNLPSVNANDLVDGVSVAPCTPSSGTKFQLGTTTVICSKTDTHGNKASVSYPVAVRDTTGPNLIVPAARSVYATTPTGIPNTVSGVVSFLGAASATDIVDGSPVITNNAPSFLPVGNLTITFAARDFSGNVTYKSVNLIVLPQPPLGTPPLVTPPKPTIPAQPTNVKITPLDGAVRIQWNAGGRQVMVTRSSSSNRSLSAIGDERVVYTGNGSSYTDRGLENGVEYRYVVMAVDAAGNHSVGVAGVVVPRRNLLKSPKDGARLRKAPKLIWARDAEAQYYNAQLLLNGKKILSVWPVRPTYALNKNWKYLGRKYTLKPGLYTWYVFPGYGARAAVHYGSLMGSRTFQIVR